MLVPYDYFQGVRAIVNFSKANFNVWTRFLEVSFSTNSLILISCNSLHRLMELSLFSGIKISFFNLFLFSHLSKDLFKELISSINSYSKEKLTSPSLPSYILLLPLDSAFFLLQMRMRMRRLHHQFPWTSSLPYT